MVNTLSGKYGFPAMDNVKLIKLSAAQMPGASTVSEGHDLMRQGLIGKDSMFMWNVSDSARVTYFDKQEYQQWQAFTNQGSEAALQAARYQQQMRDERIDLANSYLSLVYDLSSQYSQLESVEVGFSQYLDYKQGEGTLPIMNEEQHQIIEGFWQENSAKLKDLDNSFASLKAFPSNLESWLSSRGADIDDEVHKIVDEMKNSWTTTRSDQVLADEYKPVSTVFNNSILTQTTVATRTESGMAHLDLTTQLVSQQSMYESTKRLIYLIDDAATEHQSLAQKTIYEEMQILSKGLFKEFSEHFGASAGHGEYSLQDMIDNYIAGKPLGMLDNVRLHESAEKIEAYWNDHANTLKLYSEKQEQLDKPLTLGEYKEMFAQLIQKYLLENLAYFANRKLVGDYNLADTNRPNVSLFTTV